MGIALDIIKKYDKIQDEYNKEMLDEIETSGRIIMFNITGLKTKKHKK